MASFETRNNSVRVRIMRDGKKHTKTFRTREDAQVWANRVERRLGISQSIESGAHLTSMIPRRVLEALHEVNFSAQEVIGGAIDASAACGIYFLIREGEVSYIGQTKDVFLRLSKHRRDGRRFDAYNFLPCPESELDRMERMYIEAFMPKENMKF